MRSLRAWTVAGVVVGVACAIGIVFVRPYYQQKLWWDEWQERDVLWAIIADSSSNSSIETVGPEALGLGRIRALHFYQTQGGETLERVRSLPQLERLWIHFDEDVASVDLSEATRLKLLSVRHDASEGWALTPPAGLESLSVHSAEVERLDLRHLDRLDEVSLAHVKEFELPRGLCESATNPMSSRARVFSPRS